MYNNGKFHDYDFLYQHCTKKLIQQLKGDYEYEGDGLAVWDFRTEMQDGPTSKNHIIDVVYEGNDWYAYSFYDMGWKGKNRIKASIINGVVMMDGVERILGGYQ